MREIPFKMMKKISISLLIFSVALISCKKENSTIESSAEEVKSEVVDSTLINTDTTQTVAASEAQPQVLTAAPQPVQATAPGMNPPHGRPGHRCEIPVGAPLNTPAPVQTQAPAPSLIPQNNMLQAPQPQQNMVTAPGMNPPHGQPGHLCEIPVGAPLPKG